MKALANRVHHVFGGFSIGVSLYYLAIVKDAHDLSSILIRLGMFIGLMLLGLSFLGEDLPKPEQTLRILTKDLTLKQYDTNNIQGTRLPTESLEERFK